MTLPSAAIAITVVASAWVAGFAVLLINRRPRWVLASLLAAFGAVGGLTAGAMDGRLEGSWDTVALAVLLLAYAAVPAFVIAYPVGVSVRRRYPMIAAIALPAGLLAFLGPAAGMRAADAFYPSTGLRYLALNSYLVTCLGIALAEALALRIRSVVHRREAYFLILGVLALLVAGPIYRIEAVFVGLPDLGGVNWAVPLAGGSFTIALKLGDSLAFRGRAPLPSLVIPWSVPHGVHMVQEFRPTYARAMFLAAIREARGLAILGDSPDRSPELFGTETVRLPPGDRCAAVLAATASEYFRRFPRGAILVDDVSYIVTHGGVRAAAEALARLGHSTPSGATVVASLTRLTGPELDALRTPSATWVAAPSFEEELARVLRPYFGDESSLLRRFAEGRGRRVEDFTFADLPLLCDFTISAITQLHGSGDAAARPAWPRAAASLASDLETFWRTPPTELPSRAESQPLEDFPIVRATDLVYATGETEAESPPIGTALRDALLSCLGPAGEPVFHRVLGSLRKEPSALRKEDMPRVAAIADTAVSDLAAALDTESARREIVERGTRLRAILQGMAEGGP